MEATNTMIKIAAGTTDQIGYLFLLMTGIYIFYVLLTIEIQRLRINKIKRAVLLIKEGHARFEKRNTMKRNELSRRGGLFHV